MPPLTAYVGSQIAVNEHGPGVIPPGPAQIDAFTGAVACKPAVSEHIPVFLAFGGGRGGHIPLFLCIPAGRIQLTPVKIGCGTAKYKIYVPPDKTVLVAVASVYPGRKLFWSDESVLLYLLRR